MDFQGSPSPDSQSGADTRRAFGARGSKPAWSTAWRPAGWRSCRLPAAGSPTAQSLPAPRCQAPAEQAARGKRHEKPSVAPLVSGVGPLLPCEARRALCFFGLRNKRAGSGLQARFARVLNNQGHGRWWNDPHFDNPSNTSPGIAARTGVGGSRGFDQLKFTRSPCLCPVVFAILFKAKCI